jgi:hypothetical protein
MKQQAAADIVVKVKRPALLDASSIILTKRK